MFSNPLRGYFNSEDMRKALHNAEVSIDEICFDLDKPIENKILWAIHNQEKLENFSKEMFRLRNWNLIAKKYNQLIKES